MLELQSDGQWPLWRAPRDDDGYLNVNDGYGHIAAYVTPTPVERYLPPGHRDAPRFKDLKDHQRDLRTVESLWEALVDAKLGYSEPPWNPAEGQRIRDPEWLLRTRDRGAGTCIDLSLLFAAQCLNEKLDTYLVMLHGDGGHVMVAVSLGTKAALTEQQATGRASSAGGVPGVSHVSDRKELIQQNDLAAFMESEGDFLLLDVVTATAEDPANRTLDAAIREANVYLRKPEYTDLHLVNVAVRQNGYDDKPLKPPQIRGALRGRIAPPERKTSDFPAHEEARQVLDASRGKIIVSGPQGVGKSTLARKVAGRYDGGFGWFLNASSRVAFDTALAEQELIENGEEVRPLEAIERQGKARDALDRLRRTEDRWVIVIDNANEGAGQFDAARYAVDRLPTPRDGQLIIATSTASPEQWPHWTPAPLPTVPYEQLSELGNPVAARLSAGRPLLWAAFDSLLTFSDEARDLLATSHNPGTAGETDEMASDDESTRRAAALHWNVARQSLAPAAVSCAERMAWLPPDRIEPGCAGDDESVRDALLQAGLLTRSATAGALAMHRLFGSAIRTAVAGEGRAEATVRDLLARPEARTSLLRYGDAEVTTELASGLAETDSGVAVWALATLQEVYGGKTSTESFERARRLLDPPANQEERSALADCLHASARVASNKKDASKAEIDAGIADTQQAIELRDAVEQAEAAEKARQVAIAKHEAILALLRQRAVKFVKDPAEKIRQLYAVLDLLEKSWKHRLDALGPDDPLVDRAHYNLAGVRLSLAKLDRDNARTLMAGAREVYETTLDFRRRYYNGSNPITAASVNGVGIWGFESIRLGVADDPDAVLGKAIRAVTEALDMRRESGIANDIEKSATLLAKLAVLQVKAATGTPEKPEGKADTAVTEVISDLKLRDLVLRKLQETE